jgi:peptidoglycan-associated lipoprotein
MKLLVATIVAAAALSAAGCKKKSNTKLTTATEADRDRTTGDRSARSEDSATGQVSARDGDSAPVSATVYFEFDSSQIDEAGRSDLQRLAGWLEAHPNARITIEGHADERGTTEYNIALGQRRAQAIQDYLVRLGVPAARLRTISYGEERPATAGDGEEAWALNRRGELVPN